MPHPQGTAPTAASLGPSRRDFLRVLPALGFLGGLGSIGELGSALAAQADVGPELVRLSSDIEPIVRVIEQTPRERVFEAAAGLLRSGVGYRHFMAALYLAGIRNVDSRSAGSRFHCVYVINSAHLLAQESPAEERFLPLFWALDDFKGAQASRPRLMGPLRARTPSGGDALSASRAAVLAWDRDAAEIALAGVARTCGAAEAFEELWRLGARDYRPIGHKAIFVANTWRTLQTIGWQHAEPAFRSLGQALAGYGPDMVNGGFNFEGQCHAENEELVCRHVQELAPDWADASIQADGAILGADADTAAHLLAPIRAGNASKACREALSLLLQSSPRMNAGVIWDAVHLAAAEFMLRRGDIGAVHAVTSINALHFGFRMAHTNQTRLYLLLQAVGWMAHFASGMGLADQPEPAPGTSILDLAPPDSGAPEDPMTAAQSILSTAATSPPEAARAALAYARRHPNHPALFTAARRLVFTRAVDTHDYKYPAAAFEDIPAVSARWQPHMLAASMLHIPAPSTPESPVIQRARQAVTGL